MKRTLARLSVMRSSMRAIQKRVGSSARGLLLAPVFFLTGCLDVRNEDRFADDEVARCATCHGDPDREGDYLARSAPPVDLLQNAGSEYPGVGAHQNHLRASDQHAAIACSECHVVPDQVSTPGHADDDRPAEVVFGEVAGAGERSPAYDFRSRRCSDTWCHQGSDPVWNEPREGEPNCQTCHGFPPEAPHPQDDGCSTCHGSVVDDDGMIRRPALHVDGRVQYDPPACQACHGDDESPAPPPDTSGNVSASFVGVGAHRVHVSGTDRSRAVECDECHIVPDAIADPAHIDGLPAEVHFSGVALTRMRSPIWDRETKSCEGSWCHGPDVEAASAEQAGVDGASSSPEWTSDRRLTCEGCHGDPPADPHPQMERCSVCHGEVVDEHKDIIEPSLHVDGELQVDFPMACNSCHGGENPAPPTDVSGNEDTRFAGVGAHQTHVLGTDNSRAVPCEECHEVPDEVLSDGHIDTLLPAEVSFSGVATSYGAPITYEGGTCMDSYCHGAVFFDGRLSGGSNTEPSWTTVDGTQGACGTCHGLPPPRGHPQVDDCQYCHRNVRPDNESFFDPSLHVNGISETYLP